MRLFLLMPFAAIIIRGRGRTEYEGVYGPFPTEEAAESWLSQEGMATEGPLGDNGRWGVIMPLKSPAG